LAFFGFADTCAMETNAKNVNAAKATNANL